MKSAGKVMATAFWDAREIVYTDYLEKGKKILCIIYIYYIVLCVLITPVERRNQEKTSSFEKYKDPLPSRQCGGAQLRSFDGQNYGIKIRIITTSTVFGL